MMPNITKHLKKNTSLRTHVVQIRLNDEEKAQVDLLCEKLNIRPTRLLYEFFRFSIEQYQQEQNK